MTYKVDILNPKATKLLQEIADLNLIAIKQNPEDGFMKVVAKLRNRVSANAPSLEEITKEVGIVRAKRHAQKKG